jgi:hypothetical protein
MRYLMLVRDDPDANTCVPEAAAIVPEVDEIDQPQVRIPTRRYEGPETATSARRRRGKALVTDGPFLETKEGIAGWREK